jgi:hypothetical protein
LPLIHPTDKDHRDVWRKSVPHPKQQVVVKKNKREVLNLLLYQPNKKQ